MIHELPFSFSNTLEAYGIISVIRKYLKSNDLMLQILFEAAPLVFKRAAFMSKKEH